MYAYKFGLYSEFIDVNIVNDICMAYKDLFTVCKYFFIITAQVYFVPM